MSNFLTIVFPDGRTWVRVDRLADGRVMCCLCFTYCTHEQLAQDEQGELLDVCMPCQPAVAL